MFQDLEIRFDNSFHSAAPRDGDLALYYRADAVLAERRDGTLTLPCLGAVREALGPLPCRYAFSLGERAYFLVGPEEAPEAAPAAAAEAPPPSSGPLEPPDAALLSGGRLSFIPSREYRGMGPREAVFAAAVGESLHRWYAAGRFCGRCGSPMEDSPTERARVCPACGLTVYPKICPAVIVAVTDGDRLLLTKYQGRAFRRYALVAGFAEIGESIEDTVRREVFEETGLRVKNLRFYKSQPWVFTDSLLLGFWCELDGSDAITLQRSELSEAGWHARAELPTDHSGISLTGEMIEVFRRGEDGTGRRE